MQWNDVVTLIMAGIAVAAAITAWRKFPKENQKLDAEVSEKYELMVSRAADREIKSQMRADEKEKEFQSRIDKCLARITTLENRQLELDTEVKALQHQNDKLNEWARRLAAQVVSLGGVPVPMVDTGSLKPRAQA